MKLKDKYYKQSFDPRWISKKNEILSRDNCICTRCNSFNKLRLQFLVFRIDLDLWEIENSDLVTLCKDCQKLYKETHTIPYKKINDPFIPLNVYLNSDFIKKYKQNLPTNGDIDINKTIDFIESNTNLQRFENFLIKLFAGEYEPPKLPEKRMCEYEIDEIVNDIYKDSKGFNWLDD